MNKHFPTSLDDGQTVLQAKWHRLDTGELFVAVQCPCCKGFSHYRWHGKGDRATAFLLFRQKRGRRCSCTLAMDLYKGADTSMLHKRNKPTGVTAGEKFEDDQGWKKYPSVIEFLTCTVWPDGTERVPGTINVFVAEGKLKVCINDKDADCVAFTTLASISGMLSELEAKLSKDDLDWRVNAYTKPGGKGKK